MENNGISKTMKIQRNIQITVSCLDDTEKRKICKTMKRKMCMVKDVWMALGLCYSKCYIQVWNKPIKTIHHIIFFVATLKRIITAKVIITDVITVFVIIENDDFINFSFLIWSNLKINVALAVKKKRNPAHADNRNNHESTGLSI